MFPINKTVVLMHLNYPREPPALKLTISFYYADNKTAKGKLVFPSFFVLDVPAH